MNLYEEIKDMSNWNQSFFEEHGKELLGNPDQVRNVLEPLGIYDKFDGILCSWIRTGKIANSPAADPEEHQQQETGKFREYSPISRGRVRFPLLCLPPVLSEYAFSISESIQVPVDYVAVAALSCLAVAVQGKYSVQVKRDWVEPLNVYAIVMGRPSERKSPVVKAVRKPIDQYVKDYNTEHAVDILDYERKCRILKKQITAMENRLSEQIAPADNPPSTGKQDNSSADGKKKAGGRRVMISMDDTLQKQEELLQLERDPVTELHLLFDDVTPESLSLVLSQNNERAAIISAEGGIFGTLAGRYSDKPNMDLFLKGYAGEAYSTTRIGRKGEDLERPLLTMFLAIQPSVVEDVMKNRDFRGRGLTARFLYSYPESRVGSRVYNLDDNVNPEQIRLEKAVEEAYNKLITEFLSISDCFDERRLSMDPDARSAFKEYCEWVEKALNNEMESIEEWAGKLVGNTARIAGLLHCATYGSDAYNHQINAYTISDAIQIGQYFVNHADAVFNILDSKEDELAMYVLGKICSNYQKGTLKHSITKRELQRKVRRKDISRELDKYTDILQKHGYIRTECVRNSGRTTVIYIVNPEYLNELENK